MSVKVPLLFIEHSSTAGVRLIPFEPTQAIPTLLPRALQPFGKWNGRDWHMTRLNCHLPGMLLELHHYVNTTQKH